METLYNDLVALHLLTSTGMSIVNDLLVPVCLVLLARFLWVKAEKTPTATEMAKVLKDLYNQ